MGQNSHRNATGNANEVESQGAVVLLPVAGGPVGGDALVVVVVVVVVVVDAAAVALTTGAPTPSLLVGIFPAVAVVPTAAATLAVAVAVVFGNPKVVDPAAVVKPPEAPKALTAAAGMAEAALNASTADCDGAPPGTGGKLTGGASAEVRCAAGGGAATAALAPSGASL
jgi:hypothetical protein